MRMTKRVQAAAMGRWRSTAAELRHQKQLVKRGLMKILTAKLAAGLNTWRVNAARLGCQKQRLLQGAVLMIRVKLLSDTYLTPI